MEVVRITECLHALVFTNKILWRKFMKAGMTLEEYCKKNSKELNIILKKSTMEVEHEKTKKTRKDEQTDINSW